MTLSANLISGSNFAIITPIPNRLRDQYYCDYCSDYKLATFYVSRLSPRYAFHQSACCDKCSVGWMEIADRNNKHTI